MTKKFKKKEIKETCHRCGATWKGDGWTYKCPSCKAEQGNR